MVFGFWVNQKDLFISTVKADENAFCLATESARPVCRGYLPSGGVRQVKERLLCHNASLQYLKASSAN
jgi:hypothetical protein